MKHTADTPTGAYGPESDIVDFILGITFEIWEQRGVDLIHRYYAPDVEVYGMEGVIHGAQAMVDGTRQMLDAFPDRLLLGDNVVWSGSRESGFYSSHRITSPMTNLGPSAFGEATGRRVCITNVADCVVENGVVTREWLMRDNLALVRQLGFEPAEAARRLAANVGPEDRGWMDSELERIAEGEPLTVTGNGPADGTRLATEFLATQWGSAARWDCYAPYAVLHRSPVERYSGCEAIQDTTLTCSARSATPGSPWTTSPASPSAAADWTSPRAGRQQVHMRTHLPGPTLPVNLFSSSASAIGEPLRGGSSPSGPCSTNSR